MKITIENDDVIILEQSLYEKKHELFEAIETISIADVEFLNEIITDVQAIARVEKAIAKGNKI